MGLVEASIKLKIKELGRLEEEAFKPRHGKSDFHEYLKGVYNAWDWANPTESRRVGRIVANSYKIPVRANKSPIRVVIDATCNQNRQVRSRWTQALEYIIAKKVPGNRFKKFLKKNGGVMGCANKMAALRRRKVGRVRGRVGIARRRVHPPRAQIS
jgi:hypothetical protein